MMNYILILVLSTFDAFATLFGIEKGYVQEANPFMRYLLSLGVYYFFFTKFTITSLCLVVLKLFENNRLVRWGLNLVTCFYICLTILHISYYVMWQIIS